MTTKEKDPTIYHILFTISLVHLLNDSIQSVIPAIFPILEQSMGLTFLQLGLIAFALNMTASVMQPLVGLYSDVKPSPIFLPLGMVFTLIGMLCLAFASNYIVVLISVMFVGIGSAVFHPEGSRVAYLAAGPRRGLAQSIFQVGGNSGQALAPIMTALIFVPLGQFGAIWFTVVAAVAVAVQLRVASWYRSVLKAAAARPKSVATKRAIPEHRSKQIRIAMLFLLLFVFARTWYHSGMTLFYQFYIIDRYHITIAQAQIYIFLFLAAGALGTFMGGPLADKFGKRNVLLFSMLASAPLALLLPYVGPYLAYVLCFVIGFIILSSFSVTVVYAQELIPGRIGMVSGLTIGLAFGLGAIGATALGRLADEFGLTFIMLFCGLLPLIGLIALFLPKDQTLAKWHAEAD